MEKTAISLVIITLNEEKNIERCIQSAPFVKDIVVLDSGSTDKTVEIAKSLGARVKVEPWRGYAQQKIRATALARFDWVLSLDADEALSPEATREIQELMDGPILEDGFEFPRLSFHMGRWIRHGGWYPDRQLRLFNKNRANWSKSEVHERVYGENIRRLKGNIHHWVFNNLVHQVNTNNSYSTLGALDQRKMGRRFSLFRLVTKPVSKFIETYFFKRGFLDGIPGFVISVGASYSIFLKFAKLYEIEKLGVDYES